VLRWREISAECGAPIETKLAMRFNLIGTFFNQTLPSSIGRRCCAAVAGRASRCRLARRDLLHLRRPGIGLIALAIIIVASLPGSYGLISDPHGRAALLLIDFAALAGGLGFLILGMLPWPWLKHWWDRIISRLLRNREPGYL